MPFTPLHFGPGLLAKAVFPQFFWLASFLAANILIDIEVLVYLALDDPPLHRHLHTRTWAALSLVSSPVSLRISRYGVFEWPGRHPSPGRQESLAAASR